MNTLTLFIRQTFTDVINHFLFQLLCKSFYFRKYLNFLGTFKYSHLNPSPVSSPQLVMINKTDPSAPMTYRYSHGQVLCG